MRKVTCEEIEALPSGDNGPFFVRLVRVLETGPVFVYEGESMLYVQRPGSHSKGRVSLLAVRAWPIWIEYTPRQHFDRNAKQFIAENYVMEVFHLCGASPTKNA